MVAALVLLTAASGIGHLFNRIKVKKLLRRHQRIVRGDEADEQHPGFLETRDVTKPLRGDIGNASVVLRIFAFAGACRFRDRRALARRPHEVRKLFADRQLDHADAAGDVYRDVLLVEAGWIFLKP